MKVTKYIGPILLIYPLLNMLLWIIIFSVSQDQQEAQSVYYSIYPEFLKGTGIIMILSALLSLLSIIFSLIGLIKSTTFQKVILIVTSIIAFLLFCLSIFGLM